MTNILEGQVKGVYSESAQFVYVLCNKNGKLLTLRKKGKDTLFIVIRKATTYFFRIRITDDNKNTVLLTDTDKLIFTVKKGLNDSNEQPVIKKVMTSDNELEGCYGFEITPEDTADMPIGTYYYDAGVQRENGEFYRIMIPDQFFIKSSLARKED